MWLSLPLSYFKIKMSSHKKLKELIQSKDNNFTGGKGDEGGWIPNITNDTALEIQAQACEEVGDELGIAIKPSLDFADTVNMFAKSFTP